MRALCLTAVVMAAGCGDESCDKTLFFKDTLTNAAPGAKVMLTTVNCSTCSHTSAQVLWSGPNAGTTGTVDLDEQPGCFVQDTKVSRPATNGVGDFSYDWNTKNCGNQVDTMVIATNNSNQTFTSFELHVDCQKYTPTSM